MVVPNDEYTPNPVTGSGVVEKDDITFHEYTSFPQVKKLQEAVLRGLLAHPADRVIDLADNLADEDFPNRPHQVILRAIVEAAQELVNAGEGDRTVNTEVVQISLRNAAEHTHGLMTATLLAIMTGNPPAGHPLRQLCVELRVETFRRAADAYARSLITATQGPSELLTPALNRMTELRELARRAGLGVVS